MNADSVVVARPLPGSLLAPAAAVQIGDDVSGSVIADTVTQTAGTVGTTPFAAELPKARRSRADPTSPTTTDPGAADPAPAVVPQVVPPATGNNAVITVKVGGDRASTSAVGGLAGVTLQLYDGVGAPSTPVADSWATCVSDLDGDCSFIVPGTGTPAGTNPNRDRRFWVVRTTSPAGWFGLNTLVTGASPPFASTPYQFRTGDQLRAGTPTRRRARTPPSCWRPATRTPRRRAASGRPPATTRRSRRSAGSTSPSCWTCRARSPARSAR